ncbi:hypothetical protein P43SY_007226 [Pythium insidiosum]|uniref:Carrier domain-containing protein n=1 Tax=Pythium insidiosum TaxID=114742 RepID=A0AAD5Q2U3_PYTIN|nr:hypothetical protein P43SY_007226 [Pythium insidiosum]
MVAVASMADGEPASLGREVSTCSGKAPVPEIAPLAAALESGQVDDVVCALLPLLSTDGSAVRRHRLQALSAAVAKLHELLRLQSVELAPGLCADPQNARLSYAQLQMFTLQAMAPESTAYNITRAVKVSSWPLDLDALRATIEALASRHDVLRTCFPMTASGEPRQRLLPVAELQRSQPALVRHVTYDGSLQDDQLAAFVDATVREPFDLTRDAPLRVVAFSSSCSDAPAWVLAVVLHHIATDPESSAVFWSDLEAFYAQFVELSADDRVARLQELQQRELTARQRRLSYRDYAEWQHVRLQSGLLAPSLQYWAQQLSAGDVPALELPFDRSAPQQQQSPTAAEPRGDTVVFRSDVASSAAFTALCTSHGASLFIGLLAVYHVLLSRLSQCEDVVIGAPVSCRTGHDALHGLMGFFVNTLPLRLRSREDADFRGFLASVRDVVVDGFSHMEIPLQKMLEHVTSSDRQHAAFQVMFAWEGEAVVAPERSALSDELSLPHRTAKFDLMLSMRAVVDCATGERVLEGTFEYPVARFERSTVTRFGEYFVALLGHVASAPSRRLADISMLSRAEEQRLLRELGCPPVDASRRDSAGALFIDDALYEQAQRTPENVALRFEGREWSYSELWRQSTRVAAVLRERGVQRGHRVALFLDRGLELVAAIVGVLRLRAVFVPLDPSFPPERIQFMLSDCRAHCVIAQRHLAAQLRGPQVAVVVSEDIEAACAGEIVLPRDDGSPATEQDADATTAYVLYTSGSTGQPKGVMVSHANLLTTLRWTVREYGVRPDDVFLQSTSSTLDGSLTQLFSPLLAGASAELTRTNGLHDLGYIAGLLRARCVTVCVFVPSYFAMLVDFMGVFPSHVRFVVLAGEVFATALATKFYRHHCDAAAPTCLVNEYGPTEAAVTSTWHRIPRDAIDGDSDAAQQRPQSVPIGRGIDDHWLVVLDRHKQLVPVNVPGELYVGGRGVAQGYWGRPELTRQSFEHPELERRTGMRWYRTGDRVKWLASGELLFLGRTDAQVKLRGLRVELHEIRNVLLQLHGLVKDAEVLVVDGGSRLAGFVIPAQEDVSPDGLRALLAARLPMHMVPHELWLLPSWPRTPNGKLDTRALATMRTRRSDSHSDSHGSRPPQLPMDAQSPVRRRSMGARVVLDVFRQAWREVLAVEDDALLSTASFFELGGNSLAAIRVIALVKPHGVQLKLESFFRARSLDDLAQLCCSHMDTPRMVVPLNWKHSREPPLFLVHGADGTVWKMLELARRLPWAMLELARRLPWAVYGLHATHGGVVESVEQLATAYWRAIQDAQPQGPYRLGGFSFGCRVAHAIACLAATDGHAVQPLLLLDGLPFAIADAPETDAEEDVELRAREYISQAFGQRMTKDTETSSDRELVEQIVSNYSAHCRVDRKYRPALKPQREVKATLFKTAFWDVDAAEYREHGVALGVVGVAGTHATLLDRPQVDELACAIEKLFAGSGQTIELPLDEHL